MKKLTLFISIFLFLGCSTIHHIAGEFDYIAIPQPYMPHPTFSVYAEGAYGSWLKGQIESAIMRQNIAVLMFDNSKQIVTETSGDRKKAAAEVNAAAKVATEGAGKSTAAEINSGAKVAEEKLDIKTTTGLQSAIISDYLFKANSDDWTFSVVSMRNHAIVAKGTFTSTYENDIRNNVAVILKEMNIVQ